MRFPLLLLALLVCTACSGYHLGPVKPTPMKNVHRVCVKNFKNDTLEPRMEVLVTNAIIKQLHLDGTYEITDESRADAILTGTLSHIGLAPARALRGNILQSTEYNLTLRTSYRLTEARTGRVLDQRAVLGTTSFFVSAAATGGNLLTADSSRDERQAIPLAAEDLAVHISSLISEGW
jgi:hypothetical protein